jgi:ABC-type nickel/cobalt efflux system permease component RcnA
MTREWRIVSAALTALLLAAMSGPAAVRLLHRSGTISGTWLIIGLAADLASVLSLALIVAVGGYSLVSQMAEGRQT